VDEDEARRRFAAARVARLATLGARRQPHLVPVTFVAGHGPQGDAISFAVDAEPKTTRRLKRVENIARNPRVSLLVDEYADDWTQLWWVRADGEARVVERGPLFEAAVRGLAAKYPQYAEIPPAGPVVVVDVEQWRSWEASPGRSTVPVQPPQVFPPRGSED
jgi:PPOX class probable F420-dependent enzyme